MFRSVTKREWSTATEESNRLFIEAARLDDEAYSLLCEHTLCPEILSEFSAAKKIADAKFAEARAEWANVKHRLEANRAMHSRH